jgi:benzoyl-CoA reductase/2-hydroxyglutaryl-CoA dehydratase subunit BcrC/BadD/HgdB
MRKNFETRYPGRVLIRKDKKFERLFLEAGKKNVELMKKAAGRAKAMDYFYEFFTSMKRVKEMRSFDGKVIGYFCNFVPEEIIYACGALPLRLCSGFYDSVLPAEELLPRDICPLIKSSFGFKILGLPYFDLCDAVIIPTSCDGKKKLGEVLSDYLPVYVLELPNSKDGEQSSKFWLSEIKSLRSWIEGLTGVKAGKSELREAIELLHERTAVFRRLYELRKCKKPVISGRDSLLVVQASFYDDVKRWIGRTSKLCDELEEKTRKNKGICPADTARLLLTGSPVIWPNWKVLNIVEGSGGVIVIDELCSGVQHLYNPVEVDEFTEEGMLRAIAERYLLPSVCPCFLRSDDRIDRLLELGKKFAVDGVVYHSLRLCQLYDMESTKVKRVLDEEGIPMLKIHTDYSLEDVEPIRTRVEAFLEMIKVGRVKG